ncbi:MAG: dienelactone hydrolase family protein [Marinosulfonomonas sp.]|nr:dienelactone hydrolase family protein [Marinosulfonomonas sp.]
MAEAEQIDLTVGGSKMNAKIFPVAKDKVRGGIIMIHGGFGLEPGVLRMAKRMSLVKYSVVAPDMYHRSDDADQDVYARIANLSWEDAKADIEAARDYLMKECDIPAEKIAVLGFCMGGALAWMSAGALDIGAAVCYYPHEVFEPFGKSGPTPIDLTGDIKVPVMGHFGVEDKNPSPEDMAKMEEALNFAGVPHQFCTYKKAGHGFVSASPDYSRPFAATTSIDRTIGWLDINLKQGGPVVGGFMDGGDR